MFKNSCGGCAHNKAVQEMGCSAKPYDKFSALSYCSLRNVKTKNTYWTTCNNFKPVIGGYAEIEKCIAIIGLIYALVLFEPSPKAIPWHGDVEPFGKKSCKCILCDLIVEKGISLRAPYSHVEFCSNRHYVYWWKSHHQDNSISPKQYKSSEELFDKTCYLAQPKSIYQEQYISLELLNTLIPNEAAPELIDKVFNFFLGRDIEVVKEPPAANLKNILSDNQLISFITFIIENFPLSDIDIVIKVLIQLSPKEEKIVRLRLGIGENSKYTIAEIAPRFNTSEKIFAHHEKRAMTAFLYYLRRELEIY